MFVLLYKLDVCSFFLQCKQYEYNCIKMVVNRFFLMFTKMDFDLLDL